MKNTIPSVGLINQNVENAKKLGIAQLITEDDTLDGRYVTVDGKKMRNFGSCSYLGLEMDERMKAASIAALMQYGTQFSCSRAYLSIGLYRELEGLLEQMFERPVVVAPTTTLGHLSNIPVLIGANDAVILDHQVHSSVQTAVGLVKAKGVHVEMIRHNNMEMLENRIQKLEGQYDKVWYMADGIYSMYGDAAPLVELEELLNSYPNFYLYIDDAHGMSWTGNKGTGYVLSQMEFHPKMILITSLNKSFGAGGSAIVFPDEETKTLVRNCGSTLMFSGPIQPAMLGAAIASAKIHLSEEIHRLQKKLETRINCFTQTAEELDLLLLSDAPSPIFFIGVGKQEVGYELCHRMLQSGFYCNIAAFPSVPRNNTGIRMTLTNHHSMTDIYHLLNTMAAHLSDILNEQNTTKSAILRAFKIRRPTGKSAPITGRAVALNNKSTRRVANA